MEHESLYQTLCGLRDYVQKERDKAFLLFMSNASECDEERLLDEYIELDSLLNSLHAQCVEHSTDD